jgi:Flp pilus assembly protein TadD
VLLAEDIPEGEDVAEGEEPPRKGESWAWSNVSHVIPDAIRDAPADAAAGVWENELAQLDANDVARADMSYSEYNGAKPTKSAPIPLTRDHITAVLNTSIVVEVYCGSERNPEIDTLVGRAVFGTETWNGERLVGAENSMARVLTYAGGVDVVIPVEPPAPDDGGETGEDGGEEENTGPAFSEPVSVGVRVHASEALLSFCRGARVFTCLAGGIPMLDAEGAVPIPEAWKIPCTETEAKESDGAWESLEFSVACNLPNAAPGGSSAAAAAAAVVATQEEDKEEDKGLASEGDGFAQQTPAATHSEVGKLGGGRGLPFPYVKASADESDDAEPAADSDSALGTVHAVSQVDASTLAVSWSSSAQPATLMRAFVPGADVKSLISAANAPNPASWIVTVSRSLFEGEASPSAEEDTGEGDAPAEDTPSSPASSYVVSVPLISTLSAPGVANMLSRCDMKDVCPAAVPEVLTGEEEKVVEEEEEVEEGDRPRRKKSEQGPVLILYAQFNAPLVAAPPPPPEPKLMPSDLIPPRPAPPRAPAVSAAKVLRSEVRSAANSIVSEIYSLFGDDMKSQQATELAGQESSTVEQRRRRLLYHLNTCGAYNVLRDRLKHSMGRLVKERFPAESSLSPGSIEHGKFISDLYVFLMEEVFSVMNDMFSEASGGATIREGAPATKGAAKGDAKEGKEKKEDDGGSIGPGVDSTVVLARLGALAKEAELAGDMMLAARYHQDRVVASEDAASSRHVREVPGGGSSPWLDYASFSARMGDFDKAEECCREAVSLSLPVSSSAPGVQSGDADPDALLMQSALLCRKGDLKNAKVMLSPLIDRANSMASTMLSIVHLNCERETIKAEKAMQGALTACGGDASARFDLYHNLAAMLVHQGFADLADFTLGIAAREGRPVSAVDDSGAGEKEAGDEGKSVSSSPSAGNDETLAWEATNMSNPQRVKHLWLGGAVSMTLGKLQRAEKLLRAAIEVEESSGEAWSVLGHVLAIGPQSNSAAASAFQTALPLLEATSPGAESALPVAQLAQVYNSLGALYLQEDSSNCNPGAAKEVFLRACRVAPTSTSWLGAGIAAMMMGAFNEAEDALSEANILNNQNPRIWGYLALLCATNGRIEEAEQAMNQAIKLDIADASLLQKIGSAYAEQGHLTKSRDVLAMSQ